MPKIFVRNPAYYNWLKRRGTTPYHLREEINIGQGYTGWGAYPLSKPIPHYAPKTEEALGISWKEGQEEFYKDLLNKQMAIGVAPTGFGKTVVVSMLIKTWTNRTLVLCHSLDLVKQFAESIKRFCPEKNVTTGQDYSGDVVVMFHGNITKGSRLKNPMDYKIIEGANIVIDEAHLFFSERRRAFIEDSVGIATRIIGVTATPEVSIYDNLNEKGDEPVMKRYFGEFVFAKAKPNPTLKKAVFHKFNKTYTRTISGVDIPITAHSDWAALSKAINEDEERTAKIAEIAKNIFEESNGTLIILVSRIATIESLAQMIPEANVLIGKTKEADRRAIIQDARENPRILICQEKIGSTGLDIPASNRLLYTVNSANRNTIVQSIGRIVREMPDKKAEIHFFCDLCVAHQYRKQHAVFLKNYPCIEEETRVISM